jgi:hyaluronoglucosaminidase
MDTTLITGIIEGFYGKPWSHSQRLSLIDELADEGLNTYLYAPKFDPHHRIKWQEPYSTQSLQQFCELCRKGQNRQVNIVLSISPGLSLNKNNLSKLVKRFQELYSTGPAGLALLLDDIPYNKANPDNHVELLCSLVEAISDNQSWYFCPTAYSGYHLKTWDKAESYLNIIGKQLPKDIHVFWTGKTIVSKTIQTSDLDWFQNALKRKPLLWDNFAADDYVPANTFFPGPLTGRSNQILNSSEGLLLNPSEIFCASRMALFHLGRWIKYGQNYSSSKAFKYAVQKISSKPESQTVLKDIFGYFYTPFDLSDDWNRILQQFELYYLNPSTESSPVKTLYAVRSRLRDDSNLEFLGNLWLEIFPFVRTLLGDLDYLIHVCDLIEQTAGTDTILPSRDSRWVTPVTHLMLNLKSKTGNTRLDQ